MDDRYLCTDGCLLEGYSGETYSRISLLSICYTAGGKPVGSPSILMFNILMFFFQYMHHHLSVVPAPL